MNNIDSDDVQITGFNWNSLKRGQIDNRNISQDVIHTIIVIINNNNNLTSLRK